MLTSFWVVLHQLQVVWSVLCIFAGHVCAVPSQLAYESDGLALGIRLLSHKLPLYVDIELQLRSIPDSYLYYNSLSVICKRERKIKVASA